MKQASFETHRHVGPSLVAASVLSILGACGGGGAAPGDSASGFGDKAPPLGQVVEITSYGANAVTYWYDVGAKTINQPASANGTPEERAPLLTSDMATLLVAIYDAVIAIDARREPFHATPTTPAVGASMDAAAAAAAYRILSTLYPSRSSTYQAPYDTFVGAIADGDAKIRGLAIGDEVGRNIAAWRTNDGRSAVLPPFVPGTLPGEFRGTNPVNRIAPYLHPFAMLSTSQFRADAPPALDSPEYAADVNETQAKGGSVSAVRTPEQLEIARFWTENPGVYQTRNFRQFTMSQPSLADNARLAAQLWVSVNEAGNGCFESKYHYLRWRPYSAINLADTDNNPGTVADPSWTPVVPTPNHPEYPAAHTCADGAVAETLSSFYGTKKVHFAIDSTVTGTTHQFTSTDDFLNEVGEARIFGGMHFRTSVVRGGVLGRKAAQWVDKHYFQSKWPAQVPRAERPL